VGVEFKVLPLGLFDIFKGEVLRRPELASLKDDLIRRVRKLGQNERDLQRRAERRMLLKFHHSPGVKGTLRGNLAQTVLCEDRLNLAVIDEPVPWSATHSELLQYYIKWRPIVTSAFQRKFPNQIDRVRAMMIVDGPENVTSADSTDQGEEDIPHE
jgi:hypothetical protein